MDAPAFLDRATDLFGHLVEKCPVCDRMDGVETQAIEAIFHQPVERVLDEEASYGRLPEIDSGTPGRIDIVAEEVRCIAAEIVPVRTGMIGHEIEEHQQVQITGGAEPP